MSPAARAPRASTKAKEPLTTQARLAAVIKTARNIMRKDAGLNGDLDRIPQMAWLLFLKALDDLEVFREIRDGDDYTPVLDDRHRWRTWAGDPVKRLTGDALTTFVNEDLLPYLGGLHGGGATGSAGAARETLGQVFKETRNRMASGYLLADLVDQVNKVSFTSTDDIHTMAHLYESMLREMRDAAGDAGEFYTPRPVIRFMVAAVDPRLGETVLDPACGTGGFLVEAFEHLKRQAEAGKAKDLHTARTSLRGFEKKPLPYLLAQMNLLLHEADGSQVRRGNALPYPLADQRRSGVDVVLTNPPFGGEEEASVMTEYPADRRTAETAWLFLQSVMARIERSRTGRCGIVVPNGVLSAGGIGARIKKELLESFNLHTVVRLPNGAFAPYTLIPSNLLFFERAGRPTDEIWFYDLPLPEGRKNYTKTKPLRFEEFEPVLAWWGGCERKGREENEHAWRVKAADVIADGYNLDLRNANRGNDLTHQPPTQVIAELIESEREVLTILEDLQSKIEGTRLRGRSRRVRLSSLVRRIEANIPVKAEELYRIAGMLNHGRGLFARGSIAGADTKYRSLTQLRSGQLVYSKLFGWEGSVAVVPPEFDGFFVSPEFPVFDILDPSKERFISHVVRSEDFVAQMAGSVSGMGQRRQRVNPEQFLAIEVPDPDPHERAEITELLDRIEAAAQLVERRQKLASALVSATRNAEFAALLG